MPNPTKIVILRWDGRITNTAGSAHFEDAAAIVHFAANASTHAASAGWPTERIILVHGRLSAETYEVATADADHLIRMLMDADKEAHQQAGEAS